MKKKNVGAIVLAILGGVLGGVAGLVQDDAWHDIKNSLAAKMSKGKEEETQE